MHRKLLFAIALACGALNAYGADSPFPYVDKEIDLEKSFWTDHVHYPFPVSYSKVADRRNRQWEIAYGDLYRGDPGNAAKAPVLVLLHGRAMNSGYWGKLMEAPLAAGWRVIAIDWSNGGKSLPRNMHMPVNRGLDDSRQLVYNLVVKQLGIQKASYLGHSLGGQLAAGYALAFPANVERLVLYGTGGMESSLPLMINGVQLDDPALADSSEAFLQAWQKAGKLFSMGATKEEVEKSFYSTQRNGTMPYLKRGGELADYIVASRASALRGNVKERQRFDQVYAWESISGLLETKVGDPQSISNRMPTIKVPTLVAFGLKESAIPVPGTGNTHLVSDVVHPFYTIAKIKKSPIQIKLYENAGHFIHTDFPEQFSQDILHFLQTGKVNGPVYTGDVDKYIPKSRAGLTDLPEDLRRFKTAYEQAMVSRDLAAIKESFAPDFKHDGNTRDERLAFIGTFISAVERWELIILSVTPANDMLDVEFETRNNFGNFSGNSRLKKINGEWRFYGNQQ